jgi:hypothetical protein
MGERKTVIGAVPFAEFEQSDVPLTGQSRTFDRSRQHQAEVHILYVLEHQLKMKVADHAVGKS